MDNKKKVEVRVLPWWGKMLLGGLICFGLYKFTPLLEALYLFLQIVLVPLLFFGAIGLISNGAIDGFLDGVRGAFDAAKEKAKEMATAEKNAA